MTSKWIFGNGERRNGTTLTTAETAPYRHEEKHAIAINRRCVSSMNWVTTSYLWVKEENEVGSLMEELWDAFFFVVVFI